jgi:fructose-specific phosphotransferase system IIA component
MEIAKMIKKAYMNLELKSDSKAQVLEELVKILDNAGIVTDFEKLLNDVRIRESLSTTGIGFKIAIPHAKSKYIKEPAIAFGRSNEGIEYDSMDGDNAHLFFLICMPEDAGNLHLKALTVLSRQLIHEEFRLALEKAENEQEVLNIIKAIDQEEIRA